MTLYYKRWEIEHIYTSNRRRQWHPTPVLLPGKSHWWRNLVGCSPWGPWKSDMTERLHFHFSLSCIGEGNGNPLQCSCLGNPRDGGAWWAAVYGVAQSQTWLKWLSSSSIHPTTSISLALFLLVIYIFHSFTFIVITVLFYSHNCLLCFRCLRGQFLLLLIWLKIILLLVFSKCHMTFSSVLFFFFF